MKKYDVVVVGGGAAGLTSAIYTCRKQLKTVIVSVDVGGQALLTDHIENYPGYEKISGPELMLKFQSQAMKFGAELISEKVVDIVKKGKNFIVELNSGEKYQTKTVILASGKIPRKLGIPGEDRFMGKGVATCATCDAPLFNGKEVAVIGGGNSALEAVELLNNFATKIYLIHRRKEFRADDVIIEKVKKMKKVEILTNVKPLEIKGDKFVNSLVIEGKELKVDGVFVEIGYKLDTAWLKNLVKLNKQGEIIIDDKTNTSTSGVFSAGDVSTVPYKQAVISAGEGAKAGLEAYKYIKGGTVTIDWK
ncbi:FAD-dependent oxidoreductase [archaeon]|nr:FAD-dependent oxidoreductase [archaeon]